MSAVRKNAVEPLTHPVSIGGLAERVGVPRQRIYNLVRRGWVKTEVLSGSQVILPEEATRVLEAATRVDTRLGSRLVFNFV